MMDRYIGRFTLLIILLGMFSCKMTYNIPIEQLGETSSKIPLEDETVLVVNRGNNFLSKSLDSLTIQSFFLSHKLTGDTIINSDISTTIATQSMADQLYHQNKEVVLDLNSFKNDTTTQDSTQIIKAPLSEAQMLLLYSQYRVPKALVLEGIITQINSTVFDSQYSMKLKNLEVAGKYIAVWRYYDLVQNKVLFTTKKQASLYWNSEGYNLNTILKAIPPFYQINGNLAYVSSEDIAKKITPKWEKSSRNFFFLNKKYEQELIIPQVKKFEWGKVLTYFKKCLESGEYNSNKYKVFHNMAICEEMMGYPEKAMELIDQSLNLRYSYPSNFYKQQLLDLEE
ncbi:DUF6340 family protein [Halosquirtibacter xylanolyticus]|uniref:DUF6340 family protein n=1 Tax=Halosquirtibacter xylanolyticus TaxID=3374599 RepID=UPI00374964F8|nr:DUF6340 family protein [Prolixibacteraceae bacterium]